MDKSILFKKARKIKGSVMVPDWGLVEYRALSLADVSRFEKLVGDGDNAHALAYLISVGVCNPDGSRLFDDGDIDEILNLDAEITLPIGTAIAQSIGVKTIEDAKKN